MRVPIPDHGPPGQSKTLTKVVPASHGYAWPMKKNSRFRIVDIHGKQVVDFMAWPLDGGHCDISKKVSMSYTRFHLSGATPAVGECLWTNLDEPLLKITQDLCKVHDM